MDLSTGLGLKGLKQLRRAWIEVEQEALSRITGKVRPALPKDDLHLIRRQIDDCLSETGGAASARARAATSLSSSRPNSPRAPATRPLSSKGRVPRVRQNGESCSMAPIMPMEA